MKKALSIGMFMAVLAVPGLLFADSNNGNPSLADQFAIEVRVSPLGAASFEGIRGRAFRQINFGVGFYHPRNVRVLLRNTFGPITKSFASGRAMAIADGVEVVIIQPLPGISVTVGGNRFVPYFGWGFALTILSVPPDRHRSYSSLVAESGVDLRQIAYLGLGGLRASIRIVAGGENISVGLFLGTVLHPVPIAGALCCIFDRSCKDQ